MSHIPASKKHRIQLTIDQELLDLVHQSGQVMFREDQSRQIRYLLEIALGVRNAERDYSYQEWLELQQRGVTGDNFVTGERSILGPTLKHMMRGICREMVAEKIEVLEKPPEKAPKLAKILGRENPPKPWLKP